MGTESIDNRGKSKNRSLWTLRILLGIYAALYIIFITDYFFPMNAPNSWNIDNSALKILFGVFIIGYVISWKSELASGVIFILWFIGMCYHNFFLCTSDCGAGIAMGIPLLILSIFFIVYGIKEKKVKAGC
jgi:hypothetical protein